MKFYLETTANDDDDDDDDGQPPRTGGANFNAQAALNFRIITRKVNRQRNVLSNPAAAVYQQQQHELTTAH